jgi:hypothetical protein
MIAYKFLRTGAIAPFTGMSWPVPGEGAPGSWVRVDGALEQCANGVHACRVTDLPYWLFDELWEIELEQPIRSAATNLVAAAGRLRERVRAWDAAQAAEFAEACAARVHELAEAVPTSRASRAEGYALDASTFAKQSAEATRTGWACADAACVAYIAACAAANLGGGDEAGARERAWQSRWLAERLDLEP